MRPSPQYLRPEWVKLWTALSVRVHAIIIFSLNLYNREGWDKERGRDGDEEWNNELGPCQLDSGNRWRAKARELILDTCYTTRFLTLGIRLADTPLSLPLFMNLVVVAGFICHWHSYWWSCWFSSSSAICNNSSSLPSDATRDVHLWYDIFDGFPSIHSLGEHGCVEGSGGLEARHQQSHQWSATHYQQSLQQVWEFRPTSLCSPHHPQGVRCWATGSKEARCPSPDIFLHGGRTHMHTCMSVAYTWPEEPKTRCQTVKKKKLDVNTFKL